MFVYLCFIGTDDSPAGISNAIVSKFNEYSQVKTNHMNQFRNFVEVKYYSVNDNTHALDY